MRPEDLSAAVAGRGQRRLPEGSLADARLPLEEQGSGPVVRRARKARSEASSASLPMIGRAKRIPRAVVWSTRAGEGWKPADALRRS